MLRTPAPKAAPAARPPVIQDRHRFTIMVNFWLKVNHHEVVCNRKMRKAAERDFSQARQPPSRRGDSCAGSNGSSLDCGRVSHLGMDDQSIRSSGETLRPIERLTGSGHCGRRPRPRSRAAALDEGRRIMAKAIPAPHPCRAGTGGDDRRTFRGSCPKSRHVDAAQFRAILSPPREDSMNDSQPKRSAMNSWNRFSFAQVTLGTLGVADHICRDLALTLANSNSPAAG